MARRDLTTLAAAIAEPARGRMLGSLMDGRALTATELAVEAGVVPSTASSHLARLRRAGLIRVAAAGRHRYFRIADRAIAELLERMMGIVAASTTVTGPRDERTRRARVCYDHLAGARAVRLFELVCERGLVRCDDEATALLPEGEAWLGALGVDVAALRQTRRPLVRACLDWSERRDHLAGAVGAAILTRMLELRLARRDAVGRAVSLSDRGETFLATLVIAR